MGLIYTSQYRYSGQDRLDVTVKGQHALGRVFAPTWAMVKQHKAGTMNNEQYTALYEAQMKLSMTERPDAWRQVLLMPEVTLVCFCSPFKFCHRFLLANILVNNSRRFTDQECKYIGEKRI